MNLTFAKHCTSSKKEAGWKALYISGKWFAKKGKMFPINIRDTDLQEVDVIYSLPDNDQHTAWTPKKHSRQGTRLEISNKYWAPIRHNMLIHGALATTGVTFIIDWKRQNITNISELNAYITKLHKSDKF